MAYDEEFAARVREVVAEQDGITERKMFGGLAFMLSGNMFCGIIGNELMLRVGPARYQEALDTPHVRPMDFTGRPMTGMVYVEAEGCRTDQALEAWISRALGFARSLPPKGSSGTARRKAKRRQ